MQKANITILFSRRHLCIPFVGLFKKNSTTGKMWFQFDQENKNQKYSLFLFFFFCSGIIFIFLIFI